MGSRQGSVLYKNTQLQNGKQCLQVDIDTLEDRVMGNVGKCSFICFCFFSEIGGQLKMRRSMCWRAEDKED